MADLERARLARLLRNGQRAVALAAVPASVETPVAEAAAAPRDLSEAQRLGLELLAAASRGDAAACQDLLANRGAKPELAVDPETGRTALIAAAEGGYVDVVTLLLFYNADASVSEYIAWLSVARHAQSLS